MEREKIEAAVAAAKEMIGLVDEIASKAEIAPMMIEAIKGMMLGIAVSEVIQDSKRAELCFRCLPVPKCLACGGPLGAAFPIL